MVRSGRPRSAPASLLPCLPSISPFLSLPFFSSPPKIRTMSFVCNKRDTSPPPRLSVSPPSPQDKCVQPVASAPEDKEKSRAHFLPGLRLREPPTPPGEKGATLRCPVPRRGVSYRGGAGCTLQAHLPCGGMEWQCFCFPPFTLRTLRFSPWESLETSVFCRPESPKSWHSVQTDPK